jgi:uncharacterized RDD family membrane protein YckC
MRRPTGGRHTVGVVSTQEQPGAPRGASFGRRLAAWAVDWALCLVIVFGLLPYDVVVEPGVEPPLLLGVPESSWALMGVFAMLNIVLVSLTGSTVGHRLLGLQVWQVRPGAFPLQVVVRTVLLCLFLPAVVTRSDGRGWHDSLAGTRIVRL